MVAPQSLTTMSKNDVLDRKNILMLPRSPSLNAVPLLPDSQLETTLNSVSPLSTRWELENHHSLLSLASAVIQLLLPSSRWNAAKRLFADLAILSSWLLKLEASPLLRSLGTEITLSFLLMTVFGSRTLLDTQFFPFTTLNVKTPATITLRLKTQLAQKWLRSRLLLPTSLLWSATLTSSR